MVLSGRIALVSVAVAAGALLACGATGCDADRIPETGESESAETAGPLPNPPPRYPLSQSIPSSGESDVDPDASLAIRCTGRTPFTCPREDGTIVCSERPCVPDCSRIGCLGGETCTPCEGGFRCLASGDRC